MSADNYAYCPKCLKRRRQEIAEAAANLENAYGKVGVDAYLLAHATFMKMSETDIGEFMREDYDLGVDRDGQFTVNFRCRCERCQFIFNFKFQGPADEKET